MTVSTLCRAALLAAFAAILAVGCRDAVVAPPTNLRVVVQPPPEPWTPLLSRFGMARLRLRWDASPSLAAGGAGRYVVFRVSGARLDVRREIASVPAGRTFADVPTVFPVEDPAPLYEVVAEGSDGGTSDPSASGLVTPPRFLTGVPLAHPTGAPRCLPPVAIAALRPDGLGGVWIATRGAGLAHVAADGTWRRWTTLDGLLDDRLLAMALAPDGAVWLGCHGGLQRLDPASGSLRTWTEASGGLRGPVTSASVAPDGALWLVTGGALARMTRTMTAPLVLGDALSESHRAGTLLGDLRSLAEQQAWRAWVEHRPSSGDDLSLVAVARDGGIWAAGPTTGVLRRAPGALVWQAVSPPNAEGPAPVAPTVLAPERGGAAWLGTDRGLFHLSPEGAWQAMPLLPVSLLPEAPGTLVAAVAVLSDDRVTAVVAGQPLACSATPTPACTLLPGGPTEATRGLTSAAAGVDGAVWLGARDGRVERRGEAGAAPVTAGAACPAPPAGDVTAVGQDRSGRIWVASPVALARRTPLDGAWTTQLAGQAYPDLPITALAFDEHGNAFAGTRRGVAVHFDEPPLWTLLEGSDGMSAPATMTLAGGRIWTGGEDGLHLFDLAHEGRVRHVSLGGAARAGVTALAARPDGGLWVGTRAGLFRWTAAAGIEGPERLEAADEPVEALALDGAAGLWLATSTGLQRRSVLLGGIARYPLPEGWAADRIVAIASVRRGVAVSTRAGRVGCADSAGGRVREQLDLSRGVPGVEVRGMVVDDGGTAWLATRQAGLVAIPSVCP